MLTDSATERAERLLGIDPERCVLVPNGYNPDHFGPRHLDHRALWRRMLVDEPRGWAPNGRRAPARGAGGTAAIVEPDGHFGRFATRPRRSTPSATATVRRP